MASGSSCDLILQPYVYNLTSFYNDQRNESTVVFTSVVMFILAALFFCLNLFSRLSNVSAILNPTIRLLLSTALSLFLPVMSYLFSEAKSEAAGAGPEPDRTELSLRARTILMWMILVELLRWKLEAILFNVGVQWYSATIDRTARIAWLGYLVFHNLRSTGKQAVYGLLWVLAATKLVKWVATNELLKRSFAYGKNAQLNDSYMAQMLQQEHDKDRQQACYKGSELLKRCKYAVTGEDNLERKAGPQGYHLELNKASTDDVVTVGYIWSVATIDDDPRLRRLCLSFALYKLLRRRFEDITTITAAESRNCRDLIFRGLCKEEEGAECKEEEGAECKVEEGAEVALFQVLDEELQFLCEYYHSILPIVFKFLGFYILFPAVVWALCLLTFILCGNGNLSYTFHSVVYDNYIVSTGTLRMTACLLGRFTRSPEALFTTINISTTVILLITFFYEEVWELVVFMLSNWLIMSLFCDYSARGYWHESAFLRGLIRRILWMRSGVSHPSRSLKQFSVLGSMIMLPTKVVPKAVKKSMIMLRTKVVPKAVKKSILEYLVVHITCHGSGEKSYTTGSHGRAACAADTWQRECCSLSNGWRTLQSNKHRPLGLSWACESKSVAEVILTWHIATSLVEVECQATKKTAHRKVVATTLSKYCAYLVALHPELLPDDKDGTERAYWDMVEELNEELGGCWRYHMSLRSTRCEKLLEIGGALQKAAPTTTVKKGAKLGKALILQAAAGDDDARERVWELLAELWTELMVYVAPSSGELHVKAHKEALAQGGELVTVLWALATHTGITRPANVAPWEAAASTSHV